MSFGGGMGFSVVDRGRAHQEGDIQAKTKGSQVVRHDHLEAELSSQ